MTQANQREWTILEALKWCTQYLEEHDDPNPRLSAQWLLSYATGLSRVEVYAYHDRPLTPDERMRLREMLTRRGTGEPLQYIVGEAPFRTLMLKVTPDTLIPRPETETLVELVLEYLAQAEEGSGNDEGRLCSAATSSTAVDIDEQHEAPATCATQGSARRRVVVARPSAILDIGTGSGAVALALAQECPNAQITATDISPSALEVARTNAESLGLQDRIDFVESDCFDSLGIQKFDIIVSNPPYMPSASLKSLEIQVRDYEPQSALDGGEDGLALFRRILSDAIDRLQKKGALFVELDECNVTQAAELAVQLNRYEKVVVRPDLNGRDRYLVAIV